MESHNIPSIARFLAMGVGLLAGIGAHAQTIAIQFSLSSPSSYEYTVSNVSLGFSLKDFVIWFPDESGPGSYQNLTILGSPSGWTGLPAEPSAISLNGYVEWYTTGAGIAVGQSVGGFSVAFDNLGPGTPGSQYFKAYDDSFNEVASGWTTPVPEPPETAMATLLAAGLWVGGRRVWKARRNICNTRPA